MPRRVTRTPIVRTTMVTGQKTDMKKTRASRDAVLVQLSCNSAEEIIKTTNVKAP